MELRLKPTAGTGGKACGLLLRGSTPAPWLDAIRGSGVSLSESEAYAIPGTAAASIWGCLLLTDVSRLRDLSPVVTFVQALSPQLFVPLGAGLYPAVSPEELAALLKNARYFLHPEVGFVELEEPIRWEDLLEMPAERAVKVTTPANPVFLPAQINRFEVVAVTPEEGLEALENRIIPEKKEFRDKPLTPVEQIKLAFYRQLFSKLPEGSAKGRIAQKIESLAGKPVPAVERMQEDFEELERRNASEIEKLLRMLRDNPEEALKYAIPIGDGTGRGGDAGRLLLDKRWNSFSLFWNGGGGGRSGGIFAGSGADRLVAEYNRTAVELLQKGEYEKAAFVYLKLLKNYNAAADALEKGGLYADAAAVHLRFTKNKSAAAACYVKANMLTKAIELYVELGEDETVGDLYMRLARRDEAMQAYGKVADAHLAGNRILKAAALKREKMGDPEGGQELLLRGWRSGVDAYNCLHTYLRNIPDSAALRRAVDAIHSTDVKDSNAPVFLSAIKGETGRSDALDQHLRAIAIEIIATRAKSDPALVSELREFSKGNRLLTKDILRFKLIR